MKRIFDDPSHAAYGPVRRLWVILAQLNLLESAEGLTTATFHWDQALAAQVKFGIPEATAQRGLLKHILENG